MIDFVSVSKEAFLEQARELFISYGKWRNLDAALGDFQKELDELPGKYAEPAGTLLLALENGKAIGSIAYQQLSPEICEMKRMYVLEAYRGKGIGRKLVEKLIAKAQESGYSLMRLDTHPRMTTAHALYGSMGFYEIDRYNENPTPGIRFFEKPL